MAKRTKRNAKQKRKLARKVYFTALIIFAIIAAITRYFFFEIHIITTAALEPAYLKGDVVVMIKFDMTTGNIARGDFVYTYYGSTDNKYLRIVRGVPGDLIDVREDGKYLVYKDNEGVMREKNLGDAPALVHGEIPKDAYLLLADDLTVNASDSRTLGLVYKTDINARPGPILWPLQRAFR